MVIPKCSSEVLLACGASQNLIFYMLLVCNHDSHVVFVPIKVSCSGTRHNPEYDTLNVCGVI